MHDFEMVRSVSAIKFFYMFIICVANRIDVLFYFLYNNASWELLVCSSVTRWQRVAIANQTD